MKESKWESMEFGRANYDLLISKAGARQLSIQEDKEFVCFIKSLQRKRTSSIDWGYGRLARSISVDTSGSFSSCDDHLVAMFRQLGVDCNDTMFVGWHDQWESIEIVAGQVLKFAPELIFVGQGMVALGKDRRWIVEYASDRRLHGAVILPD